MTAAPDPSALPTTVRFVRDNRRLLAFGLLTAFFSSFGQTYFIGTFGDALKAEFSLSDGQFGGLYSIATLASAFALTWTGRQFDRLPLRRYVTWVVVGLVVAAVLMSTARNVWMLGLALFALRHTGQGLMSHTSGTSMARAFDGARGKALSIAAMGYPLGQAVLPAIAVAGVAFLGWRATWGLVVLVLLVLVAPGLRWLLHGVEDHGEENHTDESGAGSSGGGKPKAVLGGAQESSTGVSTAAASASSAGLSASAPSSSSATLTTVSLPEVSLPDSVLPLPPVQDDDAWTRSRVLRDPRFWFVLPAAIAPGFILTGVFFHQSTLVAAKGWDLATWTALFIVYSAFQIGGSLGAGPLVDRVTARAVLPFFLLPMTAGLVLLVVGGGLGIWLAPAFLATQGITAGLSMTLSGALWAELYGVRHLGAIRATVTSFGIMGTAASPVGMGALLDRGVSMDTLAWLAVGYLVVAMLGVAIGLRGGKRSMREVV